MSIDSTPLRQLVSPPATFQVVEVNHRLRDQIRVRAQAIRDDAEWIRRRQHKRFRYELAKRRRLQQRRVWARVQVVQPTGTCRARTRRTRVIRLVSSKSTADPEPARQLTARRSVGAA
jgi:hypothetical protein